VNESRDDCRPCLCSVFRKCAPGLIPVRHAVVVDAPGDESS
jgi:hypothetical protein